MTNIIKTWNGKIIRFREDGYGSLTDMAEATGKLVADWTRLKTSNAYLEQLSAIMGIPIMALTDTWRGGDVNTRGTWAHKKVCIRFAQWCSPEFAVWVDFQIDELMTNGTVSINQTPKPLYSPQDTVIKLKESLEWMGIEIDNPRYSAALKDLTVNILVGEERTKALPSAERWAGVQELAIEMGYPAKVVNRFRSALGRSVSQTLGDKAVKEKRLCNGTDRPINLYLVTPEVEAAVEEYMEKTMKKLKDKK